MRNDLSIYSNYAHEWWQPGSPRFRSLQQITPFRLKIIREWAGDLSGKSVADLGCGGGLLSVPLIQAGAELTGVDLSLPSLEAARRATKGKGNFIEADVRALPLKSESFDLVIVADVVDHIAEYPTVLSEAARILKPAGKIILGTINRTWRSWFLAILLGEGLRLIPKGTHDFNLFVTPEELSEAAKKCGFTITKLQGEAPDLMRTIANWAIEFRRVDDLSVAYLAELRRATASL